MPCARQASISSLEIGLEASCTSVSPRQNFLNPPPVPEIPTVTCTAPRASFWNSSAIASVIGNTVLDPSTLIKLAACTSATDPAPTIKKAHMHKTHPAFTVVTFPIILPKDGVYAFSFVCVLVTMLTLGKLPCLVSGSVKRARAESTTFLLGRFP